MWAIEGARLCWISGRGYEDLAAKVGKLSTSACPQVGRYRRATQTLMTALVHASMIPGSYQQGTSPTSLCLECLLEWIPDSTISLASLLMTCPMLQALAGSYNDRVLNGLDILTFCTDHFEPNASAAELILVRLMVRYGS